MSGVAEDWVYSGGIAITSLLIAFGATLLNLPLASTEWASASFGVLMLFAVLFALRAVVVMGLLWAGWFAPDTVGVETGVSAGDY